MARYFLDTYAIVEIIKGNLNYKKFLEGDLFTNLLNLYELYYNLLKDYDKEVAEKYFYQFKNNLIDIGDEYIFDAASIKLKYKKRRLSCADVLGYAMSLKNGMKFLTGDREFEDFEGVEFAK